MFDGWNTKLYKEGISFRYVIDQPSEVNSWMKNINNVMNLEFESLTRNHAIGEGGERQPRYLYYLAIIAISYYSYYSYYTIY